MSMANGVELRVPFLDHRLVEKVITLPDKYKFGGYELKKLMKSFLKNRLPEKTLFAGKKGTHAPVGKWLEKELNPLIEEHLSPDRVKNLEFFDNNFIQSLIQNHMNHSQNNSFKIWNLLVFSAWMKELRVSL